MAEGIRKNPQKGETPIVDQSRIPQMDALRGVALLGILLANARQMFLPWSVSDFPVTLSGNQALAWIDWFAFHAFVDLKFLTLFSLLFGAGFALQWERISARSTSFSFIYLRRVVLLGMFGVAHGLLLYPAEVLTGYAFGGLLLLVSRKLSTDSLYRFGLVLLGASVLWGYEIGGLGRARPGATLLIAVLMAAPLAALWRRHRVASLSMWAVIVIGGAAFMTALPANPAAAAREEYSASRQQIAAMLSEDSAEWPYELRVRREGDLRALVRLHAAQYSDLLAYFAIVLQWRTLALFLIGAGLYRSGLITRARAPYWNRVARVGLGVGVPLSMIATSLHVRDMLGVTDLRVPELMHSISALLVAAGIAGIVFAHHQGQAVRRIWRPFEAAGRMALTNYIGQSLVMTTIAEPWGLDLYARLDGYVLGALACAVFVGLAGLSTAWLTRFRLGPLEWIWRCGTYWTLLPNRR